MARRFQMSSIKVNVIVEGRDVDAYIYHRICGAALHADGTSFLVLRADELAGGVAGGKSVVLGFFDYLKRGRRLERAGSYTTLFCLDKDLDDLEARRRRSGHIIYTEGYDIEAALVRNADLVSCAAAAMMVPDAETAYLGVDGAWCNQMQANWAEWVALCLGSKRLGVQQANTDR
jgi:hypothetical protein